MKHNWTYRPFMECIENVKYTTKLQTKDFAEQGTYPVISQDESYISGYWDNADDVFHAKRPLVIFGDHTRVLKYIDFDFVLGADGVKILLPTEDILAKYMYYYLKWYNVPSLGYSRHFKLLRDIELPIPSLDEQQSIVRELDGINHLIGLQEEQLREYDRLAQSLFYSTFGDPATNPKGWEVKNLGDVAVIRDGSHNPPKGVDEPTEYRMLSSQNIFDNLIDYSKGVRYLSKESFELEHKRTNLKAGDVLLTIVGTIGRACIVTNKDTNITLQRSVAVLSPKDDILSIYLNRLLFVIGEKLQYESRGVAQKGIYLGQLSKTQIPLPPLALQQSFAAQIEAIEQQKALIRRSLDETRTLLAARMQYYFE